MMLDKLAINRTYIQVKWVLWPKKNNRNDQAVLVSCQNHKLKVVKAIIEP